MEIIEFKSEHLQQIELQAHQEKLHDVLMDSRYGPPLEGENSFTAMEGDQVIACIGVLELEPHRGHAWAIMSCNVGPNMLRISRAIKRFFSITKYQRIEAAIDVDFEPGIRWAELLGFQLESCMQKYTADGRDSFMYVRV